MPRDVFLELAARYHRVPIAADLVLHQHPDAEAIRRDGRRLGEVIVEAADAFHTPLALPLMDLRVEKAELLRLMGVPAGDADRFHLEAPPSIGQRDATRARIESDAPGPEIEAALDAVRYVAGHRRLLPIAMCIGPFSLATKLMADPIVPVYLSGRGDTAGDEPDVALLEACQELSLAMVLRQVERAIAAGAQAVFVAEPAANLVYVSPLQIERGSDVFDRVVLAPNRQVAARLEAHGVDLIFHCCGELAEPMLDGFCTLRPAMLSLGSSRRLWQDAARVPKDTVLYGNLPSKLFYSDALMPVERVAADAAALAGRMQQCGHPFILGTECDTLFVPEYAGPIRLKIERLLAAGPSPSP
jgi:uroporphyrinogen-III decarboxylase